MSRVQSLVLVLSAAALAGCTRHGDNGSPGLPSPDARRAIADTIATLVKSAYDITKPGAEQRAIALYPASGPVVSASAGHVVTSRDSLITGIRYFWENVAANMRQPRWIWDQMLIDVLAPNAATMTATYHIPHLTPMNQAHVIAGAWTAVFAKMDGRWVIVQEHLSDAPAPPMQAMPMDTAKR